MTHCTHCLLLGSALGAFGLPLLIVGLLYLHVRWESYQRREQSKARQLKSRKVASYFSQPGGDA